MIFFSFICCLFQRVLFNFYMFVDFIISLCYWLLVLFHCDQKWCFHDFSLLKFNKICFVFIWGECSKCAWEKYVLCYCQVGCSIKFRWSAVLFKASVCLLIFCLGALSIIGKGALVSPTIIAGLLLCPSVPSKFVNIWELWDKCSHP